jgi:phosphoglycolate phosphatase-like HAD superfamily hydrolase
VSNIIFDFDGTIADSFALVVGLAHELTGRHEPLPPEEITRLRSMSLLHVAQDLQVRPWKVPFLIARGRRLMRSRMPAVHPFGNMPQTIQTLSAAGHELYIMSSNSVQNITPFLKRYKMSHEFIQIYGGASLLGKARVLKKVIKQHKLDPAQTFYIGDEVRDIEAAKHAGIAIISVTWGYNDRKILSKHQPNFFAASPADITDIISKAA